MTPAPLFLRGCAILALWTAIGPAAFAQRALEDSFSGSELSPQWTADFLAGEPPPTVEVSNGLILKNSPKKYNRVGIRTVASNFRPGSDALKLSMTFGEFPEGRFGGAAYFVGDGETLLSAMDPDFHHANVIGMYLKPDKKGGFSLALHAKADSANVPVDGVDYRLDVIDGLSSATVPISLALDPKTNSYELTAGTEKRTGTLPEGLLGHFMTRGVVFFQGTSLDTEEVGTFTVKEVKVLPDGGKP